jgi:hypothetical protein
MPRTKMVSLWLIEDSIDSLRGAPVCICSTVPWPGTCGSSTRNFCLIPTRYRPASVCTGAMTLFL